MEDAAIEGMIVMLELCVTEWFVKLVNQTLGRQRRGRHLAGSHTADTEITTLTVGCM
jgi:hypothetical protein